MQKFIVKVLCVLSKEIEVEIESETENSAIQEADKLDQDSEKSHRLLARLIEDGTMETTAVEVVSL